MFFKIAGFELRYQLRQPIFWVGLILFVLLSFGSVASSNIQIGSTDNIHKNAAYRDLPDHADLRRVLHVRHDGLRRQRHHA